MRGATHRALSARRRVRYVRAFPAQLCIKSSASFSAELSVSSPRKLFIFIISKNIFWIKVSKKTFYLILKKEALIKSSSCFLFNSYLTFRLPGACHLAKKGNTQVRKAVTFSSEVKPFPLDVNPQLVLGLSRRQP